MNGSFSLFAELQHWLDSVAEVKFATINKSKKKTPWLISRGVLKLIYAGAYRHFDSHRVKPLIVNQPSPLLKRGGYDRPRLSCSGYAEGNSPGGTSSSSSSKKSSSSSSSSPINRFSSSTLSSSNSSSSSSSFG